MIVVEFDILINGIVEIVAESNVFRMSSDFFEKSTFDFKNNLVICFDYI